MNHIRQFSMAALLCLVGTAVWGQTVVVHMGDQAIRLSLNDIDSLSFRDAPAVIPGRVNAQASLGGFDASGDEWALPISATLADAHGNPVPDGYPVEFTLVPNLGTTRNGVTGNEGMDGSPPVPGVAYGSLRYASAHTNEPVTLIARWPHDDSEVTDSLTLTLPIQQPSGAFDVAPYNYSFHEWPGRAAIVEVRLIVTDGHGVRIANQQVRFRADHGIGTFYTTRDCTTADIYATTDEGGVATRYWRVWLSDLSDFPNDPIIPVELVGYVMNTRNGSEVESFTYFFFR